MKKAQQAFVAPTTLYDEFGRRYQLGFTMQL
jgi:hypothetical protein